MKKILVLLMFYVLTLALLTSCASPASDASNVEEEPLTDVDFIVNLGKGLEARWALADSEDYNDDALASMSLSEFQNAYALFVNAELDSIGNLEDYQFEDPILQGLAEKYVQGLNLQKEGVKYQGTDQYSEIDNTWSLGYNYRAVCIRDLYNDYGLTVKEDYQQYLNDFVSESTSAEKELAIRDFVDNLSNELVYNKDESKSNEWSSYYTTVIENTTNYEISSLSIDIDFIDASGVIIYQAFDSIQNLQPGSKAQSSVYYDPDNGDFASMQFHVSAYTN